MGKAIEGAILLAAAVTLDVVTAGAASGATAFEYALMMSLYTTGLSMEAGAVADALTSNRGSNITTRQPAGLRQIIRGTQRVGGNLIYVSSTGSKHDQYNMVIVLAGHECWAIQNLYLDGRQVHFKSGVGNTTRNGWNFGGSSDSNEYIGPNGVHYNFGGKVYCEARYGDQAVGDVIGGLTANDPNWAASAQGSPYVGGCTYVYLKIEYDPTLFPSLPEIKFTVMGKPVYDPRTDTTGYSDNWALQVADHMQDPTYGLGLAVNQDQLVAAANVCDEQVPLAGGGTEARYSLHHHYDLGSAPGDTAALMLSGAAGRVSEVGGEWYIYPAYWQGALYSYDQNAFTGEPDWVENRSFPELFNRVNGTYTAPNYPYNVAGNLYDSNGWYMGEIQDNFPYAFQPTNFPYYAADIVHGYPSDEWLAQDRGIPLPLELNLQCVLSVTQAQRVAKINLLRNRQQGTGTFMLSLGCLEMQPYDVMKFTWSEYGWTDKLLEIGPVSWKMVSENSQPPSLKAQFALNETAETVYEWSTIEELTPYVVQAGPQGVSGIPAAPTNVAVTSSAATALQQPDGSVVPRTEIIWDTPLDGFVTQIDTQYQIVGASAWIDGGSVDVSLNVAYIPVIAGQQYNFQIRSRRPNGAVSPWVTINGATAGFVLSTTTQDGIGLGSLIGEAFSPTSAGIECQTFTGMLGNRSVTYFPSGQYGITGLTPQALYYVYVDDPNATGGNLIPVATQNPADYLGVLGRYLIDSTVTPAYSTTGGGGGTGSSFSALSNPQDLGSRSTQLPGSACDGNASTYATISAQATGTPETQTQTYGDCLYSFPSSILTSAGTLAVSASCAMNGAGGEVTIIASIGSSQTTLLDATAAASQANYTLTIPSGTDIGSVTVEVLATTEILSGTTSTTHTARVQVYEIKITT